MRGSSIVIDIEPMSRRKAVVSLIMISILLAVLVTLGTWQVGRLHWKEDLLAQIEARRDADPTPLAEHTVAEVRNEEYLHVRLQGRFDHKRERHFFATLEGSTGFYIYTPLILSDEKYIFINRGFVPYDMKEADTRAQGQVEGEVELTGYVRQILDRKPSWLVPDNDEKKNIFYWKDWNGMVSSSGLKPEQVLPLFVDADKAVQVPGGWPKSGVTQFEFPNNHLQYALTWYGLALTLIAIVIAYSIRQQKRP
ncbi:SURF1 family protein [Rhizobium helianthi]|uniref:SURF1-like protein n=1 Tax=Rhizobium helianthi TaxID=1132695 RepID=A0ABW4M2P0_9HYPH